MIIRELFESEYPLLQTFLYYAIYVPEGETPPECDITEEDELRRYYTHFGKTDDLAYALVVDDAIKGMVWGRLASTPQEEGYGYYNKGFVEMNIAILLRYRGQGWGKQLVKHFIVEAKKHHYKGISLSVTPSNIRAVKLYESFKFQLVNIRETDMLMVLNF